MLILFGKVWQSFQSSRKSLLVLGPLDPVGWHGLKSVSLGPGNWGVVPLTVEIRRVRKSTRLAWNCLRLRIARRPADATMLRSTSVFVYSL